MAPQRAMETAVLPAFTVVQQLRIALRMLGIVLVALLVIPAHVLVKLLGNGKAVPPFFLWAIGRVAGLRVHVKGTPQRGALLVGNHLSWLDILALAGAAKARFVAHAGLAGNGGLKWLCDQNHTVFITRDVRGSVATQVEQVREALGERPLVIFPEGTTDNGLALLPFRSSLLSAVEPLAHEVPIQPFALEFADAGEISWFGDEPGLTNVLRVLARKGRIDVTIHFLAPLAGEALTNRKTMTATAQQAVVAVLDLPVGIA